MPEPITGKVATIIDSYTIALNIGRNHGVEKGMKFDILSPEIKIKDPDTRKEIGTHYFLKGKVQVIEVMDNVSIARSYEYERSPIFPAFTMPTTMTLKKLSVGKDIVTKEIQEGDGVRQIIEEISSTTI